MKTYNALFVFCMFLLMAGCAKVDSRTTYDTQADFEALRTYSWLPVQESFSAPEYGEFYMVLMNELLTAKGFTLTNENPDFLIRTPKSARYSEVYSTMSGPIDFHEGKMIIEFVDGNTEELIWQGVGGAYFSEKYTPDEVKESIDMTTKELLKKFPPPKSGK